MRHFCSLEKDLKMRPIGLKYGVIVNTKTKTHAPTRQRGTLLDWFENKNGTGSILIRFSVSDWGTISEIKLFGTPVSTNGAAILVDKANNRIRYKNTNGTLTTEAVFSANLASVVDVGLTLVMVKAGETIRMYLTAAPLTQTSSAASGLDRLTTSNWTMGSTNFPGTFTAYERICFNTEIDRKDGNPHLDWITSMTNIGNFVHPDLEKYCVEHLPMQEKTGKWLYDCVYRYNAAKTAASLATISANNPSELVNYTDAELGITDKTTQTARVNIFDKAVQNFFNGDGTEKDSGMPELKYGLLTDGSHTVPYPVGAVVKQLRGYNVLAYKLKSGQSLTPAEELELLGNDQFSNPNATIAAKLDNYWQHNGVYNNGGVNSIKDLIGTNHLALTGYSADELNPAHPSYMFSSLDHIRFTSVERFKRCGTIARMPIYTAPTATVDTPGYVLLDTTGTTTISKAYDYGGGGLHNTVASKASSPIYDATKRAARFSGAQKFVRQDINVTAGSMVIAFGMDADVTAATTLNVMGTWHGDGVGGATTAAISFGNFSAAMTNETFSTFIGGNLNGTMVTLIPAGQNIMVFNPTGVIAYNMNGSAVSTGGAAPAANSQKYSIQEGERIVNSAQKLNGGVLYFYVAYTTVLTATGTKDAYEAAANMKNNMMLL